MKHLLIFAKYWGPGEVKSRLAARVGREVAAQIYRLFVQTLVIQLRRVADERTLVIELGSVKAWQEAVDRIEEIGRLAGGNWKIALQHPGDLGERLSHAMTTYLTADTDGDHQVVILGSDAPNLPVRYVEYAFEILHQTDVVVGPSDDGGYYLVGARGRTPPIFHDVAWSTPQVWAQTCAHLNRSRCSWQALPTWYDIDHHEDLVRLLDDLRAVASDDPSRASLDLRLAIEQVIQPRSRTS